jgi:hypothetical protein
MELGNDKSTLKRVDFPLFQPPVENENVRWNCSETGKQMGSIIILHIARLLPLTSEII